MQISKTLPNPAPSHMVPTNIGQLGQAIGCIVTLLISGVWLVHTDWLLHFSVPALSFAGCDLMPGARGARVVQNSGHWTRLRLVPAFLYMSCFLTALCLISSTLGSYRFLSAIFLPNRYRVSRAEMSILACLTHQHTVKSAELQCYL